MTKKRPVGRPRTTGDTPLSTFRLPPDTKAEIAALMERLSLPTKTSVIRLAVRRMARTEGIELPKPKRKAKR